LISRRAGSFSLCNAQEDEIRRAAEERQRREDEEAAKWLGQISVEEAGVDAEDGGEGGEAAAARFVAYIQERKMVSIEEVGTHASVYVCVYVYVYVYQYVCVCVCYVLGGMFVLYEP
jgi:hypothetical protein